MNKKGSRLNEFCCQKTELFRIALDHVLKAGNFESIKGLFNDILKNDQPISNIISKLKKIGPDHPDNEKVLSLYDHGSGSRKDYDKTLYTPWLYGVH